MDEVDVGPWVCGLGEGDEVFEACARVVVAQAVPDYEGEWSEF